MLEQDMEYRRNLIEKYKKGIEPLFRYLSWLEDKNGQQVSSTYTGTGSKETTMAFPVYDSTLLGLVKEAQKSGLMDRNYVYIYSRYHIKDAADERKVIEGVTIKNIEVLTGILSKYILGGMTKGYLWSQGVQEGIFLNILTKFKALFELWDQPGLN